MFTWVDEAPTRRRRLNDSEKYSSLSSFGLEMNRITRHDNDETQDNSEKARIAKIRFTST